LEYEIQLSQNETVLIAFANRQNFNLQVTNFVIAALKINTSTEKLAHALLYSNVIGKTI